MKVAVTGGTGFIGRYVVSELLQQGIEVMVIGTNKQKAKQLSWFDNVFFLEADINAGLSDTQLKIISGADKLIHLAWPGLPNYKSLFHFEENLMPQYRFIRQLVEMGLCDITVTGTCFEYGKRNGCLSETMTTNPENPYALAKVTLHNFLLELQKLIPFSLKWTRLFYMYGAGQSPNSILSQLDKAIDSQATQFNMSPGLQIRDYLPVEEVAARIAKIALHPHFSGTINCCSGKGIAVKSLVEEHLRKRGASLTLNLGFYPYADYEAFEFWGDNTIWNSVFAQINS